MWPLEGGAAPIPAQQDTGGWHGGLLHREPAPFSGWSPLPWSCCLLSSSPDVPWACHGLESRGGQGEVCGALGADGPRLPHIRGWVHSQDWAGLNAEGPAGKRSPGPESWVHPGAPRGGVRTPNRLIPGETLAPHPRKEQGAVSLGRRRAGWPSLQP